ncbi:MAG: hypothetical protein AAF411_15500 [Myxococcota bacterium]
MKSRILVIFAMVALASACEPQPAADLTIEALPDVQPNLPTVPTLPPPPHPTTLSDGSYTIYGVRSRIRTTIDTDVAITGYVVGIYTPPECEEEPCPRPAAPHFWIADVSGEEDDSKKLMIVGYAENQEQIDEAVELHERGRYEHDPATGLPPIPVDLAIGNKIKANGRFAFVGSSGFNNSAGLLEYAGHDTLEAVEAED